jgi:hypothetical protein
VARFAISKRGRLQWISRICLHDHGAVSASRVIRLDQSTQTVRGEHPREHRRGDTTTHTCGKNDYYSNANASEPELEMHLELSRRRWYAPEAEIRKAEEMATRVAEMLYRLIENQGG